ncbi:MAG: transporter, partial [Pseudomonadota bacterium]
GDLTLSNGLGLSFAVSPKGSGYVEYVAQFPDGQGLSHLVNGGVAFTPRYNVQWDVFGGVGVNDRAPDFFLGAGIAIRL